MRILVDADACPVRDEIESVAAECALPVHYFAHHSQSLGCANTTTADGPDGADFALFADCLPGDIVVTDDTGLAALVLGRGVAVLSSRGRPYTTATINASLHHRHAARKARRAGKRFRGPRALTRDDRVRFIRLLRELAFPHATPS
jgi:uncharacterized protein